MLKCFLKWLIFPLGGTALALFYLLHAGTTFKAEEIKFEPLSSQPNYGKMMKGASETEWEGKRVLTLEKRSLFYFSFPQNTSLVLQLKTPLRFNPEGERLTIFINHSFLTEIFLKSSPNHPDPISVTLPFYLLREKENHLEISRSRSDVVPLYLESLKIRNYKGYSTGLLTAYSLPLPLNPSLPARIHWNAHETVFLFFMAILSLFGLVYSFLLSLRLHLSFPASLGKGAIVLLPALLLALMSAMISRVISGHIIFSFNSFVLLNTGLTAIAMAIQLKLMAPLWKFLKRILGRRELVVLFLTAATFLSVLYLYSFKFDKNITGFMVIGDYFEAPQIWTSQTVVHKGSVGYDGQFYYYIAHDPFILGNSYNHIDFPAYRYQRIIYPLTAWLFSLGRPGLIPYMMVAVNLLGVLSGTCFIMLILRHYGRSPWYSLFYASFWGFLLCLMRSLPEPLAVTFLIIAVYSYLKEKPVWQSLFLALAALTQETSLMVTGAFLLYFLGKKDFRRVLYLLFPPLVYLLWQLYIFSRFQTFSFLGGTQNFGPPLWGVIEKIFSLAHGSLSYGKLSELLYLLTILFCIILALVQAYKFYSPFTLSFLGYALMIAFLNQLIWVEPWSYARATLGLLAFDLLIFTKEGRRINLFPMFFSPIILLFSLISMKLI